MDLELDASKIPTACLPLWIERGNGVSDEEILNVLKSDHLIPQKSVTLIFKLVKKPTSCDLPTTQM